MILFKVKTDWKDIFVASRNMEAALIAAKTWLANPNNGPSYTVKIGGIEEFNEMIIIDRMKFD